ncbi:Uncharacterised protein [uncultured archaeon]|nr:Uncharacterised protein [uncultured archaeon]
MKSASYSVLALLLLAASLCVHAALPAQVSGVIEPDMSVQSNALASDGATVMLYTINGAPAFLVVNDQLLTDSASIQSFLEKDVRLTSGYNDTLDSTTAAFSTLQSVRTAPEAHCAQYTAVDRFPCFNKASCVKAAQANPQTSSMINAEGFWEAMVDWQAQRAAFNTSANALAATLASPSPSADYAASVQGNLSAVRRQFDVFMHNDLYRTRWDADCPKFNRSTCFEFCTRTNWTGEENWSAMESQWYRVGASLTSLKDQPARAQALAQSTAQWLDYAKNRPALWSAMDSEMSARESATAMNFSASSAVWSDPALASDILSWKQSLNSTRALAASGKIHSALAAKPVLINQSDALEDRIADHQKRADHIRNSLKSIQLAIASLNKSGSNQSASFAASYAALASASAPPIPAAQLANLETQSAQLEQLTLSEVARMQLNAPPASQDSGAAAQAIVQTNANAGAKSGTNASASANASSPAPGSSKPNSSPLPCALPAAGLVMLLGVAIIRPKRAS